MVAFCMKCGASLPPTVDVIIRNGKELPSPHYKCLACNQIAGESKNSTQNPELPSEKTESGKAK